MRRTSSKNAERKAKAAADPRNKVYLREECPHVYVHWSEAGKDEWALTDDGYIQNVRARSILVSPTGMTIEVIEFRPFGRGLWVLAGKNPGGKYIFERQSAKREIDEFVRSDRGLMAVIAYVQMVRQGQKIDWAQIGRIYQPDAKAPDASAKVYFRSPRVKTMVKEELKKALQKRDVDEDYVIEKAKDAISIAKDKKDPHAMLKGAEFFADMLDMKPDKETVPGQWREYEDAHVISDAERKALEEEDQRLLEERDAAAHQHGGADVGPHGDAGLRDGLGRDPGSLEQSGEKRDGNQDK